MFKEFRTFISRGNVVDFAVGVIIGAAFGKIVSSLIADIIMPPIGMLIKGIDFKDLKLNLSSEASPVFIQYGNFIQILIEFLILAFVIFLFIRTLNRFKKKEEAKPVEPTASEVLLTEIRDLLKK